MWNIINTKALADSNVVSANQLALAEANLRFTEIRAPFNGIVGRFGNVRLGALVDDGDLLTTLSDNSKMWVYFNVPEKEYLNYAKDKNHLPQVQLELANGDLFNQNGKIETIEADFNNTTGNVAFRAGFINPTGLLRNGETGNILMKIPMKNAMLLVQAATFEILNKRYVFVLDSANCLQLRPITVGYELPHIYQISSGLEKEDRVLVEGLRKVKKGERIIPTMVPQSKVLEKLHNLHAE